MKNIHDEDFDVERDLFLAPAEDRQLDAHFGHGVEHFESFPSPTAMSQLAEAGILVRTWDLMQLGVAMHTFHGSPSLHFNKESIERERRIAELTADLSNLLSHGEIEEDGWRTFWGNADWSDFEETLEAPEPEGTINVPDLREDLVILENSAKERLEWLQSAKQSIIEPQSNRADRIRYFYWLILIAFWRYQLRREIGTCTSPDRDAYGPLVKFIQVMSARGMSQEETKGTTIRAFIRRSADRTVYFESYFEPHSKADPAF
ncbi:hypothetical protein C5748_22080 [Phyllobacterium phragmitis]|uniref:Uncharacterized protein n=1 Tax=Phyllobacterium phragmitis TaxID=2670329 RepID=A0A2S9ILH0_9HYPH|nr:hypothetical protein [Phyllobacterium phragmitis]PRD41377.1 hypothetical protein C5748_22080 [Phyllobacterium phragmitis]